MAQNSLRLALGWKAISSLKALRRLILSQGGLTVNAPAIFSLPVSFRTWSWNFASVVVVATSTSDVEGIERLLPRLERDLDRLGDRLGERRDRGLRGVTCTM